MRLRDPFFKQRSPQSLTDDHDVSTSYSHSASTLSFALRKTVLIPLVLLFVLISAYYHTDHKSMAATMITGQTIPGNADLQNGLVLHYTFDGANMALSSGTREVLDKTISGNHGNWQAHATTTVIGRIGQGLYFDGVNDEITTLHSIANPTTFTISVWFKTSSSSGHKLIGLQNTQTGASASQYDRHIYIGTDGKIYYGWYTGTSARLVTSTRALNDGKWHHAVGVRTATGDLGELFIDGVSQGTTTGIIESWTGYWRIGASALNTWTNGSNGYYEGSLDDVRIYNRALSASEVQRLYQLGGGLKTGSTITTNTNLQNGLVGHWTFDGPKINWASSTAEVLDSSASRLNGNATNMSTTSTTIGKMGQGFDIYASGGDGYINLGDPTSGVYDFGTSDFTVSTWVRFRGYISQGSAGNVFLSKGNSNTPLQSQWSISTQSDNIPAFSLATASAATSASFNKNIADNKWHHLIGVRSGTIIISYLDGVQQSIGTVDATASVSNALNLYLGTDGALTTRNLNGVLDDVRIYNRALSATEVQQLYNLGSGVTAQICRESTIQDADGNTYDTVAIGSQCWMKQNLRVGTRINGSTNQTNNGTIEKYCYDDTLANCMTNNNPTYPDGGLYQWDEAMQYSTSTTQGICPSGWHIPADAEWYKLENFLKDAGQSCSASRTGVACSGAGTKLKPGGSSNFYGNLAGNTLGISFTNRGSYGLLWSSSESGTNAWYRYVDSGSAEVGRVAVPKTNDISVRCIQD